MNKSKSDWSEKCDEFRAVIVLPPQEVIQRYNVKRTNPMLLHVQLMICSKMAKENKSALKITTQTNFQTRRLNTKLRNTQIKHDVE